MIFLKCAPRLDMPETRREPHHSEGSKVAHSPYVRGVKALLLTALAGVVGLLLCKPAHAHKLPASFVRGALCIHSHEGSWRDPNGPYWGGMQMDYGFMRTYGPRLLHRLGTADHWSPHQQLDVSYRAWRARGWSPWPATRRYCGL